jgi:hypothetical protein
MGIKKRFRLYAPKKSYARVLGEMDRTMYYAAIAGGPPNIIPATTAPATTQLSTYVRRRYLRPITTAEQRAKMQLWLENSIERAKQCLFDARMRLTPASIPVAAEVETTMHLVEDQSMQEDNSMRIAA